jgi:hypothetical protein
MVTENVSTILLLIIGLLLKIVMVTVAIIEDGTMDMAAGMLMDIQTAVAVGKKIE